MVTQNSFKALCFHKPATTHSIQNPSIATENHADNTTGHRSSVTDSLAFALPIQLA
jgi:hypothetical protein